MMGVLVLLIVLAVLFAVGALALFVFAVKDGQFDDLETPAVRMLLDDEPAPKPAPEAAEASGS